MRIPDTETNTLLGTTLLAVPVTALYVARNAFLTVGLSVNVSRVGGKHNVFRGDGGNAELLAAIRAHGNNVEHVPLALILLLVAELCGGTSVALHAFGGALVVARLAHAFGLLKTSRVRVVGALLTLVVQLGLAGYLLWLRPWGCARVPPPGNPRIPSDWTPVSTRVDAHGYCCL